MKKHFLWIVLCFIGMLQSAFAQEFPAKPSTLVNDYTNTLTETEKASLEQKLVALDDSTSRQFTICILKSVGEYDINEYAVGLGRAWGIGTKGHDNGLLILVALGDRKISIQVGYGLEGAIPDMYARRVIDQIIKPNFKAQQYYQGLDQATDALIAMSKGEYAQVRERKSDDGPGIGAVIFVIIIVIVVIIIASKGGNSGGGMISSRGSGLAEAIIWGALSGRRNSGWGGDGGSSWGGGGSSGGGFGGFGGGSFGGGGSSGSW